MASGFERLELNAGAVDDILRSDGVRQDLARRAERVKARAGPGMETATELEGKRVRAAVWTATFQARYHEARDRVLTRAIDAARG